jgi:hypothetical protein
MAPPLGGEEVEEVPLRHESEESAARRQMREVGHRQDLVADRDAQSRHLLVRQAEEPLEHAQLVHDLEGRGVNRVAAEVAQEVGVLLEHDDVGPGTRQQQPERHSGRAAARDAAPDRDAFARRRAHSGPSSPGRPSMLVRFFSRR